MKYEGVVYRPPSEARSLILQITIGCARNQCTFCSMYKDKTFRVREWEEIEAEIEEAASRLSAIVRRVFLADGDALVIKTELMLKILKKLYDSFPNLERITSYAAPKDILGKTPEELTALREAGLDMVYMGAESGSNQVLQQVRKMANHQEIVQAGLKCREAGIRSSVTLISGLGGKPLFKEHAVESAKLISEMKPDYASILTLLIEPGTPLYQQWKRGEFQPLEGPEDILSEMKLFLENVDSEGTVFRANHASNYLPLGGNLNEDIPGMLADIDRALRQKDFRPDAFRRL